MYVHACCNSYIRIYIYIYIYGQVCTDLTGRLPETDRSHIRFLLIEKATASAANLWDPMLGCLDAWMLVCLLAWRQNRDEFNLHFGGL